MSQVKFLSKFVKVLFWVEIKAECLLNWEINENSDWTEKNYLHSDKTKMISTEFDW